MYEINFPSDAEASDLTINFNAAVSNIGDGSYDTSVTFRVSKLELSIESDMGTAAVSSGSTQTTQSASSAYIDVPRGGVAFIKPHAATNDSPQMPQLSIIVPSADSSVTMEWVFESKAERTERGQADDKRFPATGVKTLAGDVRWMIFQEWGNEFFGGNATIKVTAKKGASQASRTLQFKIRGENPDDSIAKDYIVANQGQFWYAWAIGQHESRQGSYIYNQFNSAAYPSIEHLPNFGAPDGWGIMQLDSTRGSAITTDEVYNWQTNADGGIAELNTQRTIAQAYFDYIVRQHGANALSDLPASYTPQGSPTSLTPLEAATLQLYNGPSVRVNGVNIYGNPEQYKSCWEFDPNKPVGSRWQFLPNGNDYVYKVIYEEFDGNI